MSCNPTYYPNGVRVGSCFELDDGTIIEGLFKKQNFPAGGTIDFDTNLAINAATGVLVMPDDTGKGELIIVSDLGATTTLDPGTNTIQNGNTVSSGTSRRFNLDNGVFVEL